jgi:3-oxoacyl-[acyl-carrier protein] reductase
MSGELTGKTALVTGGSRGIGRGIAERMAAAGALVAVHYGSRRDVAEATVRDIEAAGGNAFAVGCDISSPREIEAMFGVLDDEFLSRTGGTGLDILVNNAGVAVVGHLQDLSEADFDRQFDTNVKGPFFVTQQAFPRLRDDGRIIFITSGTARRANPEAIAYAATKAAINYVALALAAQLGPRRITVNALAPGLTETEMVSGNLDHPVFQRTIANTALGRIASVSDIAEVAGFLASPAAGWITGEVIHATGGEAL